MDSCDRLQTVPATVWDAKYPTQRVPDWLRALVATVARTERFTEPQIRVITVKCPDHFGGRWFEQVCNGKRCHKDAIAVILHPSARITKAVALHELGHGISRRKNGDRKGHHDDNFFDIVEYLYAKYGVTLATARQVEGSYPESWEGARSWKQAIGR